MWRCSGALLSRTVLLTAGHCTFGTTSAKVRFDSEITDPDYPFADGISGTPYPHPQYDEYWPEFPNTYDVGIVVLGKPVNKKKVKTFAELPELGALDRFEKRLGHQIFTIVGYGLQSVKPSLQADRTRYRAEPVLVELNSANTGGYNIHLSSNPGKGQGTGGSCFGDSGGPAFIGDSNVAAGVGSFVMNGNCVGAGYYYRVDTEHAQNFIKGFLSKK